jgi:exopolysaccharide production protein ExoZ
MIRGELPEMRPRDAIGVRDDVKHFAGIQSLRALAASAVMIGHAFTSQLGLGVDNFAYQLSYIFPAGVDVFFVISGFIISFNVAPFEKAQGRVGHALGFAARRFARIYPLYWIVLFCSVLLSRWLPVGPDVAGMTTHLSSMHFLLGTTANWFVPAAWTLCFEVHFYALVAVILLVAPRVFFPAIACAMIAVAAVAAFGFLKYDAILLHPLVLEFGFGALVAYLARRNFSRFVVAASAAALAFFIAGAAVSHGGPVAGMTRVATYGVGSAFMVYAVVACELKGMRFPKFAQYLGEASYSLYVWHLLLLTLLVGSQRFFILWVPGPILICGWIATIYVIALASYQYLEAPIVGQLNRVLLVNAPKRWRRWSAHWPRAAILDTRVFGFTHPVRWFATRLSPPQPDRA